MEVATYMSVEVSELTARLLGEQCFQDYDSDFISSFSSSYYSSNWPQEDTYIGLNWEGYNDYCNIDATEINEGIINTKPIKRTCEIQSKLDSCIEVPKKKARISTTVSYSWCISSIDDQLNYANWELINSIYIFNRMHGKKMKG